MYYQKAELPIRKVRRSSPTVSLLLDFLDSGIEIAEVFNDCTFHNNNDMRHSLVSAVRKHEFPIKVCMINGRVFLERRSKHE